MPGEFQFSHHVEFSPENAADTLRQLPDTPGILALIPRGENAQPYLTKAANLRRRAARLLEPAAGQTKRLNLRDMITTVAWSTAGSDFESLLCLYQAYAAFFSLAEARKRLRLYVPYSVRFAAENPLPRAYVTNRLSKKALSTTYGPFPSRIAAERYTDAVLDLFKIRRCWEELVCHPDHPGCVYGEMKKCMAPCQLHCTPDEYAAEAARVCAFFETHGESLLQPIAQERETASAEMEFEKAAEAHTRYQKVKAAADLASELVQPLPNLRALIVQPCGEGKAALFLVHSGCISGPEIFPTHDIRAARAQEDTGSSLFAQPLMLQPTPLGTSDTTETPEDRLKAAIARLETAAKPPIDTALLGDHLALLKRWFYRPEKSRTGRILFPTDPWPWRRLLNAAASLGNQKSSTAPEPPPQ